MCLRYRIGTFAKSLVVFLALQSPGYASGVDKTWGIDCSQGTAAAKAQQLPPLTSPPSSKLQPNPSSEPFGLLADPIVTGEVSAKWQTVRREIEAETTVLARCQAGQKCPAAARKFISIIAEGRGREGLARIGLINRAINLAIVPTSDMKQWGVPDRWSPPLETLTTGRGDCEDYAIAKYAALLDAGISNNDLKLLIVHNLLRNEDHAILATRVDGKWYVLDNRWLALVSDSQLAYVIPLFVLDDTGVKEFVPQTTATRLADDRPRFGTKKS
jgi:predicted transglutaminase-like cysteine proteinase